MGFSVVALADVQSADVVSPGAPSIISVVQVDNRKMQVVIGLPLKDSDGSDLTGMTKLVVATAPQVAGGANAYEGMGMQEILTLPSSVAANISLTPDDAGSQKTVEIPIVNLGGYQSIAAAVTDAA